MAGWPSSRAPERMTTFGRQAGESTAATGPRQCGRGLRLGIEAHGSAWMELDGSSTPRVAPAGPRRSGNRMGCACSEARFEQGACPLA